MKFTTIRGGIRHSEIQAEMDVIGLKKAWLDYMLGKTMCAISESDDYRLVSNQGVYRVDLERFCECRNIDVIVMQGDKR